MMSMMASMLPSLSSYSHAETITLSPYNNHVVVRLQAVTNWNESLCSKNDENIKARAATTTTTTTPFPFSLFRILQEYGISRLYLSSGSFSSSTLYNTTNILHDEYSMGPSGIVIKLELRQSQQERRRHRRRDDINDNISFTFLSSLLQVLQSHRLLLAPLDAIFHHQSRRLHRRRHVQQYSSSSLNDGENNNDKEVILLLHLPLEDSAAAYESVLEFMKVKNGGSDNNNGGLFDTRHAKGLTHVLLLGEDDSTTNNTVRVHQVSARERRTMWLDIMMMQSTTTCNNNNNNNNSNAYNYTLQQGIQYGVVLPPQVDENKEKPTRMKLSQLVPFQDFQECPVSTQKTTRLSTITFDHTETVIEEWNMDTLVEIPSSQPPALLLYGNRILERPHGVANTGRIVTRIRSSLECPTSVLVTEALPRFVRPLWDTWTLSSAGIQPLVLPTQSDESTFVVQYNITIPPKSSWQVSMDYEPVLLSFQQFPADPNRGMELPPTQFTFTTTTTTSGKECLFASKTVTLYSSPILIMPPVPDMSMPFNVISLTCTLYAFVIGSLANLLVRKASTRIQHKLKKTPLNKQGKWQKWKQFVQRKLQKLLGKTEKEDEKEGIVNDKNEACLDKNETDSASPPAIDSGTPTPSTVDAERQERDWL